VGLVPVVSVTVPLTPSHTWLVAHAIEGLAPAAAPAVSVIVLLPMKNLPETNPVAVVLPAPVTVSTVDGLAAPFCTSKPLVPLLAAQFRHTA
jgi:hypothetical protein